MIRPSLYALAFGLALGGGAVAQDAQTLADIRAEIGQLQTALETLKAEMLATGSGGAAVSGSSLQRLDAIEAELTRLTGRTESLELRIDRVIADGTNRIGDLEFRLTELEGGDLSSVGATRPLGGDASGAGTPQKPAAGAEMAVGEQADFDRAKEALDSGSFRSAADLFATFTQTYTGGPLTGQAHYWRGVALDAEGDTTGAARAWLESYSGSPSGEKAPDALFRLGQALGKLGQKTEACVTLGEVSRLFPGSDASGSAIRAQAELGC